MLILSLLPLIFSYTTLFYAVAAFLLGLLFVFKAFVFAQKPSCEQGARSLFIASVLYLPLLLIALTVDCCLLG